MMPWLRQKRCRTSINERNPRLTGNLNAETCCPKSSERKKKCGILLWYGTILPVFPRKLVHGPYIYFRYIKFPDTLTKFHFHEALSATVTYSRLDYCAGDPGPIPAGAEFLTDIQFWPVMMYKMVVRCFGRKLLCTWPVAFILPWTSEKWNLFLNEPIHSVVLLDSYTQLFVYFYMCFQNDTRWFFCNEIAAIS